MIKPDLKRDPYATGCYLHSLRDEKGDLVLNRMDVYEKW